MSIFDNEETLGVNMEIRNSVVIGKNLNCQRSNVLMIGWGKFSVTIPYVGKALSAILRRVI